MKNLNLNACGVQEMSSAQMQGVEGGNLFKVLLKIAEALELADMITEFSEGFVEGVQEGYNAQQR